MKKKHNLQVVKTSSRKGDEINDVTVEFLGKMCFLDLYENATDTKTKTVKLRIIE